MANLSCQNKILSFPNKILRCPYKIVSCADKTLSRPNKMLFCSDNLENKSSMSHPGFRSFDIIFVCLT